MSYNTVIFDLDGTLLNSIEDLKDSVNYALDKLGFPKRSLEEVNDFVGNGVGVLIEKAVPEGALQSQIEDCLTIFRQHYTKNMENKTAPYKGILELLHTLKDNNYKMAVVSNKYDAAVKSLCEKYFDSFIKVAIGESPDIKRKPEPDSVYKAIKELASTKEKSIYVGDSEVDVRTAHNAGIKCIGVSWGFRGRDILEKEAADFIVDSPEEIFEILEKSL